MSEAAAKPQETWTMTPRQIVAELDRFIIGQKAAKCAVAIAIRNRWRRQRIPADLRDEVMPKNLILIGPTGVGKTEIARRLASLIQAPFVKVEATKYTQVGYVGRDVESMIRDLADKAFALVKKEAVEKLKSEGEQGAEDRILGSLLTQPEHATEDDKKRFEKTRERLRQKLRAGELDHREIEIEINSRSQSPNVSVIGGVPGGAMDAMGFELQQFFENMAGPATRKKTMTVGRAKELLVNEEAEKLLDDEQMKDDVLNRTQNTGIVFIDEIDKVVAGKSRVSKQGPDVSGEGVQRDLLPIVEGSTVQTRYGQVATDHILFIAAGAFHVSSPSDLIPELQGRFPIRVELNSLNQNDLMRILTEPDNALVRQYQLLLATEDVKLEFQPKALEEIARIAELVNSTLENIGARRLHTILENLLDDWLFDAPEKSGASLTVDAQFVSEKLKNILKSEDLTRFIL